MSGSDITVLYVYSDETFTEFGEDYIQQYDDRITVRTAQNGTDALTNLEASDEIDCVVSGYRMPGLNGLELLKAIRSRWPKLPFVLFAGEGSDELILKALNAGATDYLQDCPGTSHYPLLANRIRNLVVRSRDQLERDRTSQRTEAQFRLLVETVEDYAIFLLDADGHVQTWNAGAEKIKGYTSDEILGERFSVFYRGEDIETDLPDHNLREATTKGHIRDEGWRVRSDGSEFWAEVVTMPLYENDLIGYAKVTHDTTQHHQEQLLFEQNEQLKEFITAISHDLRNPLQVAEGNVELAFETGDLSHLETATQAHERVNELLDHLGTLAREGKQILDPEQITLQEVAEAAWRVVQTDEAELISEGTTQIIADRRRLQQLFENLFVNAIEHAGRDVTVRTGSRIKMSSTSRIAVLIFSCQKCNTFLRWGIRTPVPGLDSDWPSVNRSLTPMAGTSGQPIGRQVALGLKSQMSNLRSRYG